MDNLAAILEYLTCLFLIHNRLYWKVEVHKYSEHGYYNLDISWALGRGNNELHRIATMLQEAYGDGYFKIRPKKHSH